MPIKNKIDINGYFYGDVDVFANCNVKDVNLYIVKYIKEKANLLFHEVIVHRYPHCWRHKTPLIFRTTNQWFLNMDNMALRERIINLSSSSVKWAPDHGKKKIYSMLIDRPDWCLSRQRIWGVPIFLFVCKDSELLHPNSGAILDKIIELVKVKGTAFWYNENVFDLFNVDSNIYNKVTDVLDVWYDSSSVYKFLLDKFDYIKIPFDLCLEGNDQYRGWFQASLINSVANFDMCAFKLVIAHGFVLDGFGRKMSKSLNNVISPHEVINVYGADVLRLWVSSVNYFFDVNISDEILSRISECYRKIRNTFRFLLSNVSCYNFNFSVFEKLNLLYIDKWILNKFILFKNDVLFGFNDYKFHLVYKKIYSFCIDELGCKFFEIVKDRLYLSGLNSFCRLSSYIVIYYMLYNFVKLISPILSFTAEEIWLNMNVVDAKSVYMSSFDIDINIFNNDVKFNVFDMLSCDLLFFLKDDVNKIIEIFRTEYDIGTSLELNLDIFCNSYWFSFLNKFVCDLHLFFLVSGVNIVLLLNGHGSEFNTTGINYKINKSVFSKCCRCWHRNVNPFFVNELQICARCVYNIYYNEEIRLLC